MAFTRVDCYLVMYPTGTGASVRAAKFSNFNKEALDKISQDGYSETGSSCPDIANITFKDSKVYAWRTNASCRESLLSTVQGYIKEISPWLYKDKFESRIYFRTTTPFSAAVFKRGLELSGINPGSTSNPKCALSLVDPCMFWIKADYFDWCKLSVLLFVLRAVDFIKEHEFMTDDKLIKAIIMHPEESFPNNSNEPWLATVLAYAIYSRNTGYGYVNSQSLGGYSWFGGHGNGVNSVTINSIHRDLERFAKFVRDYKISETLINNYLNLPKIPGIKNNTVYLKSILGEYTLSAVETSSIPPTPTKVESWDDEDSGDDDE